MQPHTHTHTFTTILLTFSLRMIVRASRNGIASDRERIFFLSYPSQSGQETHPVSRYTLQCDERRAKSDERRDETRERREEKRDERREKREERREREEMREREREREG